MLSNLTPFLVQSAAAKALLYPWQIKCHDDSGKMTENVLPSCHPEDDNDATPETGVSSTINEEDI